MTKNVEKKIHALKSQVLRMLDIGALPPLLEAKVDWFLWVREIEVSRCGVDIDSMFGMMPPHPFSPDERISMIKDVPAMRDRLSAVGTFFGPYGVA